MFQKVSDNNIDVYADSVSEFISKCIGDVVPLATIKTFPKQKLWIDGCICAKLKVFTDIFNQSLYQSAVPTCFKRATVVPVPKKAKVTELNDYHYD